jgi:hypothetical protein
MEVVSKLAHLLPVQSFEFTGARRVCQRIPDRGCASCLNPCRSRNRSAQIVLLIYKEFLAERVGFEPTCRFYPTIRFRIGAVMTASVPLRM